MCGVRCLLLITDNIYNYQQLYDGVRRRALPALYKSLEPGTDDDRMKGALWTLNFPSFGRYAISGQFYALPFTD